MNNWQDEVIIFDKHSKKYTPKKIFRRYLSFGKIPQFDSNQTKSYMFSGSKEQLIKEIPKKYKSYIEKIKKIDNRYNQFVINYYANGKDYIEPHSDCDKQMVEDYRILIFSLGQERILRLTSRKNIDVKIDVSLKDNSIFLLDKDLNNNYRHEILKDNSTQLRVSITARMIK